MGPVENGDKSQFDQLSDFQSNSYVCLSRTFIQNMTSGYAHLRTCSFAPFKRMRAVMRSIWQCLALESTREKNGFCTRKSGLEASCTTSYFVLKANNEWHDTREPYLAVRTPDSRDEVNKGEQTWQRKIFEELYRYEVQNQSIGIDFAGTQLRKRRGRDSESA